MKPNSGFLADRHVSGFTLLEMAFVLLVMGIVVSMLLPTASGVHNKSMIEEDRKILSDLKDVIIGQFLASNKLPLCKNAAGASAVGGNPIPGNCDTTNSIGNFGARVTDVRGRDIKYDVWNAAGTDLTDAAMNAVAACARLKLAALAAAAMPPAGPAICSAVPDYGNPVPTPYCAAVNNIAFVLVGSGRNYPPVSAEVEDSIGAQLGNKNIGPGRVFERPSRRHNESIGYDDLMEVVTFQQLLTAGHCPL